jgi:plastocyanin
MSRFLVLFAVVGLCVLSCVSFVHAEKKEGQSHAVTIKGMAFNPAQLEIAVGDSVVWTNKDDRDYNVVAKDSSFKSDSLRKGDTFKYTFTKAGQFTYVCSYHPRMKGVIVVNAK